VLARQVCVIGPNRDAAEDRAADVVEPFWW